MQQTIEIIIRGKVQNVFYRGAANQKATELGIKGTAQNMPDGTVRIIATANMEVLHDFKEWCWEGSESAIVTHVETKQIPFQHFDDFRTIRNF